MTGAAQQSFCISCALSVEILHASSNKSVFPLRFLVRSRITRGFQSKTTNFLLRSIKRKNSDLNFPPLHQTFGIDRVTACA
jgi:hypothetical protein